MYARVSKEPLLTAVQTVQRGTATQTTIQILTGVLIKAESNKLSMQSTNLEVSIWTEVPAEVKKPGVLVVPAKLVADIVKNLPEGRLTLESGTENQVLKVSAGKAIFKLRVMLPEDFPSFPKVEDGKPVFVSSNSLQEVLRQALKAVSRDETRPILNGCLVSIEGSNLRVVATDSYRLAIRELKVKFKNEAKVDVVVPWRSLDELQKVMVNDQEVNVLTGENQIVFKMDGIVFVSRLIEGQFPNYKQLLPKEYQTSVEIDRDLFVDVVTRAALVAQKSQSIKIRLDGRRMIVSSQAQGIGESQEELTVKSKKESNLEIAFNAQYLLDGITSIKGESLILQLNDAVSPGLVRPAKSDDYLYLIMPIRIGA